MGNRQHLVDKPARSIRSKLMLVVLATTAAALVVAALALILYESRAYERTTAGALMSQAEILGRVSAAALVFDDPKAARDVTTNLLNPLHPPTGGVAT